MLERQLAGDVAERPGRLAVGEDDLVDVDVAPAAGRAVDDLEPGGLAGEVAHVPAAGSSRSLPPGSVFGPVAVRTTLPSTSRLMQVSPAQPPPPIEEADRPAIDRERRGRERAGGPVAAGERIDEPAALEALDGHLARQGAPRRAAAEGGPLDGPPAVVVPLEVGDHDVGGLSPGRRQPGPDRHAPPASGKSASWCAANVLSPGGCIGPSECRCALRIGAGGSRSRPRIGLVRISSSLSSCWWTWASRAAGPPWRRRRRPRRPRPKPARRGLPWCRGRRPAAGEPARPRGGSRR